MSKKSQKLYASLMATTLVASAVAPVAFAEDATTPITAEVKNNVGKKDEVVVKAVPAGATVKIYLGETDITPAFSKKQGSSAGDMKAVLTYDLPKLEAETKSNIYITVTAAGATESTERTSVEYSAEPQTTALTAGAQVLNKVKKDSLEITLASPAAASAEGTAIKVGAVVKVYKADATDATKPSTTELGKGKIAAVKNEKSITKISFKEALTNPTAGEINVFVTVQNPGQAESKPFAVKYGAETVSSSDTAVVTVQNLVAKKDTVTVKGLAADKKATVNVYKVDPDALVADAKKDALIGTGKSKAVTIEGDKKDGQAIVSLKAKNGFADVFEKIEATTKVYVTVQYDDEHESKAVAVGVDQEAKTKFNVVTDPKDATTTGDTANIAVVVTNVTGVKDYYTVTGAPEGAEITILNPDDSVAGKGKVKKAAVGKMTETVIKLSKGFSKDAYVAGKEDKYKIKIKAVGELESDAVELTALNAEETKFEVTTDNITAANNVKTKDTLTIKGLPAKTVVNVYNVDPTDLDAVVKKKALLAKGTVKAAAGDAATETKITISKGFPNTTAKGNVYVEIIETGKLPLVKTFEVDPEDASTIKADAKMTVTNGLAKDTIAFEGLTAKDVVTVYSGLTDGKFDKTKVIGKATVKAGATAATVSISKKFTTKAVDGTEAVYITVQSDDKAPVSIKAKATVKNGEVVGIEATTTGETATVAIPKEITTTTPAGVTFTPVKVTATSFGFEIPLTASGDTATPFKEGDTIKLYASTGDTRPAATIKISAKTLADKKAKGTIKLNLADNAAKTFFYTLTGKDQHEGSKETATAIFAKSDKPKDITEVTATKDGKATITVETVAVGDIVKVYDGTKVAKKVTVTAAGSLKIDLTGIKTTDKSYTVTITSKNKAESAPTAAKVNKYVEPTSSGDSASVTL